MITRYGAASSIFPSTAASRRSPSGCVEAPTERSRYSPTEGSLPSRRSAFRPLQAGQTSGLLSARNPASSRCSLSTPAQAHWIFSPSRLNRKSSHNRFMRGETEKARKRDLNSTLFVRQVWRISLACSNPSCAISRILTLWSTSRLSSLTTSTTITTAGSS